MVESSSNNYQVQNGVNINSNVDTSWIISSIRKESHILCLAVCNSNQECLSSVYMDESVANNNCILYKKYFDSTEITTSNNTKLFIKNSKIYNNYNNNNNVECNSNCRETSFHMIFSLLYYFKILQQKSEFKKKMRIFLLHLQLDILF